MSHSWLCVPSTARAGRQERAERESCLARPPQAPVPASLPPPAMPTGQIELWDTQTARLLVDGEADEEGGEEGEDADGDANAGDDGGTGRTLPAGTRVAPPPSSASARSRARADPRFHPSALPQSPRATSSAVARTTSARRMATRASTGTSTTSTGRAGAGGTRGSVAWRCPCRRGRSARARRPWRRGASALAKEASPFCPSLHRCSAVPCPRP